MSTDPQQVSKGVVKANAGKYLTFKLATEEYGLEILKVQEIIGIMPVTRVPKMPSFVRGIINLRGKLIPVIDMRERLNLEKQADTEKTCIIVVQIIAKNTTLVIGVLVDMVSEVLDVKQEQIVPPPSIGTDVDVDYILGIAKVAERVVILLDIDNVLSHLEVNNLTSIQNN